MTQQLDAATWLQTTSELRELGWRVTLVTAGPAGERLVDGVETFCLPKPEVYLLGQVVFHLRLLRFIVQNWTGIDVILFHQDSAPWLLPLRTVGWLQRTRRPVLVMDTRTVPMSDRTWRARIRGLFHTAVSRLAYHWVDGHTVITRRMGETVGIPPQKLWGVWSSGVDMDQFSPALEARRWPVSGEPIDLVYIGVLNYERNLLSLCQAVEKANAEGMALTLTIAGKGTEQSALAQFARQTDGRIRVLPPVPHGAVPRLLAEAHVGVLPFPDEERFGVSSPIKLFEYMAAGLPILATRIDCHTDVVGDGGYAFWAESASVQGLLTAVRLAWQGQAHLERMGQEAAAAAQAWTWQESAKNLSDALELGMKAPGKGAGTDYDSG